MAIVWGIGMNWPTDPAHLRNYIAKDEHYRKLNDYRWQMRWGEELTALQEPSVLPTQEDVVYLKEVIAALTGRPRTKPEVISRFIENVDMGGSGGRDHTLAPLTNTEKCYAAQTRKWLRAWAEENG